MLAALLQSIRGHSIRLYEKRPAYTRTRMVRLASYIVVDSPASYHADRIDGENVEAIFDPAELAEQLAFRQSIRSDLMSLLHQWTQGFCPLNTIEQSLARLIDGGGPSTVERVAGAVTVDQAIGLAGPEDLLIDCTGCKSLLRDHLLPRTEPGTAEPNTLCIRLEYAVVITFLYGQPYACNEYCKYYKNIDNTEYKFIPAVDRTCYDGDVSHVTGIVNISTEDFERMPPQFDGRLLRSQFPAVARSMDRFIDKLKQETRGEILGDLEVERIPLNLYRARNATNRGWPPAEESNHGFARCAVFLVGDSAIGSPYFQSISLGFECALCLAGLLARGGSPMREIMERYESYIYKQWLRVYMRSRLIKHNKDIFESVDDPMAVLEKLHIY
jgi:2-polyprenyl-6-methoxyphenol hydroxylase-like FAD-dependent oxidoreductase